MIRETEKQIYLVRTDAELAKKLDARKDLKRVPGTFCWDKITPVETKEASTLKKAEAPVEECEDDEDEIDTLEELDSI